MMTRVVALGFAPVAVVFVIGCATTGGMRSEPLDVGVVREFNRDLLRHDLLKHGTGSSVTYGRGHPLALKDDDRLFELAEKHSPKPKM